MVTGPLVDDVVRLLAELDPETLVAAGAPADEYLPEAEDFARRLARGERMSGAVVTRIWTAWFYPGCGLVRHRLAAPLAERLNALAERPSPGLTGSHPGPKPGST